MKKALLALAVLSPLAAAAPASALPTGATLRVFVEGNRVGTWVLRNRVVDVGTRCRYTIQWSSLTGGPPLGRTVLAKADEYKASDAFDCETSRRGLITTYVTGAPGTWKGFDEFGQEGRLTALAAGEDSSGLHGVIAFAAVGDIQSFEVR